MAADEQTDLMASKYWKKIDYTKRGSMSSFLGPHHSAFSNF